MSLSSSIGRQPSPILNPHVFVTVPSRLVATVAWRPRTVRSLPRQPPCYESGAPTRILFTQPLVLGGGCGPANTSIIEREKHLAGHAQLRRSLKDLEPGAQ